MDEIYSAMHENSMQKTKLVFITTKKSDEICPLPLIRPRIKNVRVSGHYQAERAGFECHPLNGGQETRKRNARVSGHYQAERAGFEPAIPCSIHAFQACALSQTTRPLQNAHVSIRAGSIIPSLISK